MMPGISLNDAKPAHSYSASRRHRIMVGYATVRIIRTYCISLQNIWKPASRRMPACVHMERAMHRDEFSRLQ